MQIIIKSKLSTENQATSKSIMSYGKDRELMHTSVRRSIEKADTMRRMKSIFVAIGLLLLSSIVFILFKGGEAQGYESSIYFAYPLYMWAFIYCVFVFGLFITIIDTTILQNKFSLGIVYMTMSNSIAVLIPYLRGYYMIDPYDATQGISYVRDISISGHVFSGDFYPALHIIFYDIFSITQLPYNEISLLSLPVFYLFYLLGIVALAKQLNIDRWTAVCALIISSPLVYPEALVSVPRTFIFSIFPLFLSILIRLAKSSKRADLVVLIAFIVLLVTGHPLNGGPLLFIPFLIILILRAPSVSVLTKPRFYLYNRKYLQILFMWFGIWILWVLRFTMLDFSFQEIAKIIPGQTYLSYSSSVISSSGLPFYYAVEIVLKQFFGSFLYTVIGLTLVMMVVVSLLTRKQVEMKILFFAAVLIAFCIWIGFSFVLSNQIEFYRIMPYTFLCTAFLLSFTLKKRSRFVGYLILILLVCTAQAFGMASLYSSPWTSSINTGLLDSDVNAVYFISGYENFSIPVLQMWFLYDQVALSVHGDSINRLNTGYNATPPLHLNYNSNTIKQEFSRADTNVFYLLVPSYAPIWYVTRFPQFKSAWHYSQSDMGRLQNQSTTSIVYSNPTFQVLVLENSSSLRT